jgi:succinate dehydrogenase / fumarate reductase, membrane anchor subunit
MKAGLVCMLMQWFKLLCTRDLSCLCTITSWVGMRDIWMDYVKPVAVRLLLQVLTILWLVACAAWTVQILWSV